MDVDDAEDDSIEDMGDILLLVLDIFAEFGTPTLILFMDTSTLAQPKFWSVILVKDFVCCLLLPGFNLPIEIRTENLLSKDFLLPLPLLARIFFVFAIVSAGEHNSELVSRATRKILDS